MAELLSCVRDLPLVDHHCHGVLRAELDRAEFEGWLTEAEAASPLGGSLFDSQVGFALRRWCAPVLDLAPHAAPEQYLARRRELGATEVNRRFLTATGSTRFLVDGIAADGITQAAELGALANARADNVIRLEQLAEDVLRAGVTAAGFAAATTDQLAERAADAVGCKSIAAYRVGLALAAERPTASEVRAAAGAWLTAVDGGAPVRLADEVLHRFLFWSAIDLGKPIQVHVGLGDADIDLHRCDPLLLTELIRASRPHGVPIMLLHNYPYHRHAGYLAQVYEHVFVDVGLATHNTGPASGRVLAELLELAPFGKVLFSSDAFGLAELYHLGTLLFRTALSGFLRAGLADDEFSAADAERITALIGARNARRVYGLEG